MRKLGYSVKRISDFEIILWENLVLHINFELIGSFFYSLFL